MQRPAHGVVEPALTDHADVVDVAREHLVQLVLGNELDGVRQALVNLVLLLQVGRGRQGDAVVVEVGLVQRLVAVDLARPVVLGLEADGRPVGAWVLRSSDSKSGLQ